VRTYEARDTAMYHNRAGIVIPVVRHRSKTSKGFIGKARDCADAGVRRCCSVALARLIWEVAD